jgi:hypothetical protein
MGLLTVFRRDGSELVREFRRDSLTVLFYRIERSDDPTVIICKTEHLDFPTGRDVLRFSVSEAERGKVDVLGLLRSHLPAGLADEVYRFLARDVREFLGQVFR